MHKTVVVVAALLALSARAEARPHHTLHRAGHFQQPMTMLAGDEKVVGARPSGCPNAFCGCEASLYKFGRIIPELNLASNWRRFPRAAPSSGMAAVSGGHVMILEQHVAGDVWLVHDGNSGGHVTREHPRSIAGYTIVDPSSGSGGVGVAGTRQSAPSYASAYARQDQRASYAWQNQGAASAWQGQPHGWQGQRSPYAWQSQGAYGWQNQRTLVAATSWRTVSKLRRHR
jgi:hypothetical protein